MELDKSAPQFEKAIQKIGITNPESITTKQASAYLTQIKNIPTAPSSLSVYRCISRGPTFKRVGRRCYYTIAWLDKWAAGIEIKIFDHTIPTKQTA
ncbi:MAG: hypothetical protein Q8R88_16335 [Desulfoprunum sp.]|nr:hypothetical protein [Desulfoprunum sp.]